jgi:hypothetical protein
MLRVQQTVVDHSERLARLERQRDEDARLKSVWGTSSPFPSVLSGTPQQGNINFLEELKYRHRRLIHAMKETLTSSLVPLLVL